MDDSPNHSLLDDLQDQGYDASHIPFESRKALSLSSEQSEGIDHPLSPSSHPRGNDFNEQLAEYRRRKAEVDEDGRMEADRQEEPRNERYSSDGGSSWISEENDEDEPHESWMTGSDSKPDQNPSGEQVEEDRKSESATPSNLPPPPSQTQQQHGLGPEENSEDLAICRICFDGPGASEDGGESLGRLLSPCRCKGTMKYVHATCLDRWRALSSRNSSVVSCDQCGAPYRFKKSRFVGLATSPTLLFVVSLAVFLTLIWMVGFLAGVVLERYDKTHASAMPPVDGGAYMRNAYVDTQAREPTSGGGLWRWLNSDPAERGWDYDAERTWDLGGASYTSYWGYGGIYYEPAAYLKLIKEAVRQVISGEATVAVKELVGVVSSGTGSDPDPSNVVRDSHPHEQSVQALPEQPEPVQEGEGEETLDAGSSDVEPGFWGTLLDEWKYGKGGIWEGQRPKAEEEQDEVGTKRLEPDTGKTNSIATEKGADSPSPSKIHSEKYDARLAGPYQAKLRLETERRSTVRSAAKQNQDKLTNPKGSWIDRILLQFSLGFSLVGIVSFVNLLLGVSFLGPFNLHNFGLGRSFARMTGGGRRGAGGGGQGEGGGLASVLLLLLVVIGIVRALTLVYKGVKALSRRFLSRLEAAIVDWHGEDEENTAAAAAAATSATRGAETLVQAEERIREERQVAALRAGVGMDELRARGRWRAGGNDLDQDHMEDDDDDDDISEDELFGGQRRRVERRNFGWMMARAGD
ncbi:hypothetical protein IE53DRAFT_102527 [Violaceomyces palustris]|uniref:Uncharacterized protein n=1 Tax=Violaceomyces palustris TaxID=1673888 RepID=A0ACD0NWT8_9BASI|nr:hypothetical protein IE53DRAFT_102527 [Violaceomyces palustris]